MNKALVCLVLSFCFGITASASDYSDIVRRSDAEMKELKLYPAYLRPSPAPKTEPSGFVVAGDNDTAVIRRLPSLNGLAIATLEAAMRPGALSGVGFLGKSESLIEILAADNDTVRAQGLSHRTIGFHLRVIGELGVVPDHLDFTYLGERFSVVREDTHGFQESPFEDGTRDGRNATVTNLATGKRVSYALLVPRMIERYGFYEGRGTPYRLEPSEVIAVLGRVLEP